MRLKVMSYLPLVRRLEEDKLRRRFLLLTRMGTLLMNRFPVRNIFGMTYGRIGPKTFMTLARVKPQDSFLDNVTDYLGLATVWGLFPVEVISAGEHRIEVRYSQCPLGIKKPKERKLCEAYMAMEPKLSQRNDFHTIINVQECIPDGGGCCIMSFARK